MSQLIDSADMTDSSDDPQLRLEVSDEHKLFARLLSAHRLLVTQCANEEAAIEKSRRRRNWRGFGGEFGLASRFNWTAPVADERPASDSLNPPEWGEFFSVDQRPFLMLRTENRDIRDVTHRMNIVVQDAAYASLKYHTPLYGQMSFVDLSDAKSSSLFVKDNFIRLDRDGSIGERISIDSKRYYSSSSLRGSLTAVSRNVVLRGWALNTANPECDVPLTAVIDGKYKAHFFARDAYRELGNLKQYNFQAPDVVLDGKLHCISLFHAGCDKPIEGAAPVFVQANNSTTLVISAPELKDGQLSLNVVNTTRATLDAQAALIDHLRVSGVREMLQSTSWIATAPIRVLSSKIKNVTYTPIALSAVRVENCVRLHDYVVSSNSWRSSRFLRKIQHAFFGEKDASNERENALFGLPLCFQLKKNDETVARKNAMPTKNTAHFFSNSICKFSHNIEGDINEFTLAVFDSDANQIAEISLGRLFSLLEISSSTDAPLDSKGPRPL